MIEAEAGVTKYSSATTTLVLLLLLLLLLPPYTQIVSGHHAIH